MKNWGIIILLAGVLFVMGCTQNIPMKSSINEYVLMNIKTSSQKGINFTYSSNITNPKLNLVGKNMKPAKGYGTYNCDENTTLKSMISEYLQNKFFEINGSSPLSIDVKLEDFYVQYYCTDTAGAQILSGLAASLSNSTPTGNYLSSSKIALVVTMVKDGQTFNKRLTASSDYTGSGATVKNIGDSISQANNKVLMLLNAYLAENGL
jgi:hypothetical protein